MSKREKAAQAFGKRIIVAIFLATLVVAALFAANGCGGGSGVTPAKPNPEVKQTLEVKVATINAKKGSKPVAGATVTYKGEDGVLKMAGATDAAGSILVANLAEGEYLINILHGPTSTPNFAAKIETKFILTSESTTANIGVDPLFDVAVPIIESATPRYVNGAEVALVGTSGTYTQTTDESGIAIFHSVPMGTGYSVSVTNLGSTDPRIGLDTESKTFEVYEDLTGDKAIKIEGLEPTCWEDTMATDCSGSNPGGVVHPGCTNPGTSASVCIWYDGAGRIVAKYQKVHENGRVVFKAIPLK